MSANFREMGELVYVEGEKVTESNRVLRGCELVGLKPWRGTAPDRQRMVKIWRNQWLWRSYFSVIIWSSCLA
jgi:hypothetical protein